MRTLPSPALSPSEPVRSHRRGRHAAPRETLSPTAKAGLAGGLAVALLPFGTGSAGADEVVAPASSDTATATTTSSAPADEQATPAATPAATRAASESAPAAQPTAEATPAPAAAERATTEVRLAAPARDADGRVPVSVRLLADGKAVKNGFVRLERRTSTGWTYAGRLLTRADGLGAGTLRVPATSDLRASYVGTGTRTADTSDVRTVTVPLVQAGTPSTARARTLLATAAAQIGKPYVWGAVGPSAFDCSGFTRYVYSRVGKSLPHNSHAQERASVKVSKAQAKPGDLVFIKDVSGHVGIYAGNGMMYDAPRAGKRISLRRIWTPNYVIGRV